MYHTLQCITAVQTDQGGHRSTSPRMGQYENYHRLHQRRLPHSGIIVHRRNTSSAMANDQCVFLRFHRSLNWTILCYLKMIGKGFYRKWVKSSFEQFITTLFCVI